MREIPEIPHKSATLAAAIQRTLRPVASNRPVLRPLAKSPRCGEVAGNSKHRQEYAGSVSYRGRHLILACLASVQSRKWEP